MAGRIAASQIEAWHRFRKVCRRLQTIYATSLALIRLRFWSRVYTDGPTTAGDLQHDTLPDYSLIVPNLYNDGHNDPVTQRSAPCGDHRALQEIDAWLKTNMEPLIESKTFQRAGLLVIVFDEGCEAGPEADWTYDPNRRGARGGGHIPALIISSRTPAGTARDGLYHHESVLHLSLRALGVEHFPGRAKEAPDMDGFFSAKAE